MAICGKCRRRGTVQQIRDCALNGIPHKGEKVPKVKWGNFKEDDVINAADTGGDMYEGELPPAGVYVFNAKIVQKVDASTGNPMLKILWLIDGKKSPGENSKKYNGAPFWDNTVVVEQNMWKVKQLCAGLGITAKDFLSGMVVDEDGKVTKIGPLIVEKGIQIKAAVKRKPDKDGNLQLDFGRYLPIKSDEETDAEADSDKSAKGKAKGAPASKADSKAKKSKKDKGNEPPF